LKHFAFLIKKKKLFQCYNQCCGAVLICCGSGSDFGKVLVPGPVPADPDNIEQFSNNKKFVQNLAFSISEAALFLDS
jgi:hypothetical protein